MLKKKRIKIINNVLVLFKLFIEEVDDYSDTFLKKKTIIFIFILVKE